MIPKHIVTCWVSDTEPPELIKKCIDSQKIEGYTHHLITLDNYDHSSVYVWHAIQI